MARIPQKYKEEPEWQKKARWWDMSECMEEWVSLH